jgi:DNA-binding NtrC family response regulator
VADILVVDDDQSVASAFERFLRHEGHRPFLASDAADAFRQVGENKPDLVFMDVRMPGVDGLQALKALREQHPDVYVVIMTAHGTSQTSIDAIRAGAFEYVTKPLDLDTLRTIIGHALSARRGRDGAQADATPATPSVALVGNSPSMQDVYKMIGRLAVNEVPALVVGERGTGKELVVSTIHQNSARRDQPFVTIDCATASPETFEADTAAAQGGTLHLASAHALPRAQQVLVSRILRDEQQRSAARPSPGPRVIASTDHDLVAAVEDGAFSRELFETLSIITLNLKPLRERREDIPALVAHFVQRFNDQLSRGLRGVDDAAMRRLVEHSWPGNAAELESALKRACIVTRGEVITSADLGDNLSQGRLMGRQGAESALARASRNALQERLVETPIDANASLYHDIVGIVEAALVNEALTITNGNQVKASELLGVNRATLRKKAER